MVGRIFKDCLSKRRCTPADKCDHPYSLDYTPDGGTRCRMSILKAFGVVCTTETEAAKVHLPAFITEVNAAHKTGRAPFAKVKRSVITTFHPLLDEWVLRYHGIALADCEDKDLKSRCAQLKRDLGNVSLVELQQEDVLADYKTTLLSATKANGEIKALATANRLLADLRTMFSWALTRGYVSQTPFHKHGVTIDTDEENRRDRRLHDGEEDSLLGATVPMAAAQFQVVGKRMYRALVGALDTGLRQGEMLRAQVEDMVWGGPTGSSLKVPFYKIVNGKRVRNSKHQRKVAIPVTERLYDLLIERKLLGPKAYLFGDDHGHYVERMTTSWETLKLLANGYEFSRDKHTGRSKEQREALAQIDLHWHDLRHECISRWAEADGANGEPLFAPHELMELAGHRSLLTTQRYLNARGKRLSNQMAKFSARQAKPARKLHAV